MGCGQSRTMVYRQKRKGLSEERKINFPVHFKLAGVNKSYVISYITVFYVLLIRIFCL